MTDPMTGPDAATGQMAPDNEVLRALSAAMAALFGDAPDSWLFEAEDVVEHLQADGYRIVRADDVAVSKAWLDEHPWVADQLPQPGDLNPLDPVGGGE